LEVREAWEVVHQVTWSSPLADPETGPPPEWERRPEQVVDMMEVPAELRMLEKLALAARLSEELRLVIRMSEEIRLEVRMLEEIRLEVRMSEECPFVVPLLEMLPAQVVGASPLVSVPP